MITTSRRTAWQTFFWIGVVALVSWLGKPTYTPLFSGIDPTDASAIVELLQTDGVPYELTAGGGTILVPENVVYDERLKAAAAGLPAASSGGGSVAYSTIGSTSSVASIKAAVEP